MSKKEETNMRYFPIMLIVSLLFAGCQDISKNSTPNNKSDIRVVQDTNYINETHILYKQKYYTPLKNNNDTVLKDLNSYNIDSIWSNRKTNTKLYSKIINSLVNRLKEVKSNHIKDFEIIIGADSFLITKSDSIKNQALFKLLLFYQSQSNFITEPELLQLPYGSKILFDSVSMEKIVFISKTEQVFRSKQLELCNIWRFYLEQYKSSGGDYDGPDLPPITAFKGMNLRSSLIDEQDIIGFVDYAGHDEYEYSNCDYRFPDIGIYKIFYIICDNDIDENIEISRFLDNYTCDIGEYESGKSGVLLFYDTLSHKSTIIPVYAFQSNYDYYSVKLCFRFFYITKDKKILIYEGESIREKNDKTNEYYDKYKITLNKTHIITVDKNNEIIIDNLINNGEPQ